MQAIETAGLTKIYRGRRVVDSLNLTVGRGDVYGLVGHNGAGKSTAMKMLAGLALPSSGEIRLFGTRQPPGTASPRLGFVIESPGLHPGLTVLDNVMYRALSLGIPNAKEASLATLAAVGLERIARKRVRSCSLGMKQRIGLALALAGSPDVLLLDEPFNGLDPQGVHDTRELIVSLAQTRGITVLVSSHVIDQLERMVTRYGIIRSGRLVHEATAREIARSCRADAVVRCDNPQLAAALLHEEFPAATFSILPDSSIKIPPDIPNDRVGRLLAEAGIAVFEFSSQKRDVEDYFMDLMGSGSEVVPVGKKGTENA